ncbi:hypothetical protein Krac_9481 [Ktedonobacter racemifer DSM 44963]|uniref:Uncharacterized protein n=1 Tax=Ktedonobacter racemifer DSM 44963 TaxID=485913 RepID=D6TC58_KTERA|nr:hypothetical protein Krac_9481 [Ktedonobacter racemifer DSM 44963]
MWAAKPELFIKCLSALLYRDTPHGRADQRLLLPLFCTRCAEKWSVAPTHCTSRVEEEKLKQSIHPCLLFLARCPAGDDSPRLQAGGFWVG